MKRLLITIAALMSFAMAEAQNLNLIMVAATEDKTLGESVKNDEANVTTEFKEIAQALGYSYNETIIDGESFKKAIIKAEIDKLSPNASDIVVFMYAGHGFRFEDDTDQYPRMQLRYKGEIASEDDYLAVSEVYNTLKSKNALFTLVITDCCNNSIGISRKEIEYDASRSLGSYDIAKLKSLFTEQKGSILITAAEPGQLAYCTESGGFMTTTLIEEINTAVSSNAKSSPRWNDIIDQTRKRVHETTKNETDEEGNPLPQVMVRSIDLNTGLSARSSEEGGSMPVIVWVIIGVAVVGAGFALLKKKNKK